MQDNGVRRQGTAKHDHVHHIQSVLVDASVGSNHSESHPHRIACKPIPFTRITRRSFSSLEDLQFLLHNVSFLTAPVSRKMDSRMVLEVTGWFWYATNRKLFVSFWISQTCLNIAAQLMFFRGYRWNQPLPHYSNIYIYIIISACHKENCCMTRMPFCIFHRNYLQLKFVTHSHGTPKTEIMTTSLERHGSQHAHYPTLEIGCSRIQRTLI